MNERDANLDDALDGIDASKRATLRRLMVKSAFVVPVVASFAMSGLTVEAVAQVQNSTSSRPLNQTVSDRRLKTDITRVATHPGGFGIYRFKYLWSDVEYVGVMAQEVRRTMPNAVVRGADGFLRVDYAAIGLQMERCAA